MTTRAAIARGLWLLVWAAPALAQEVSLLVGGTHARYADSLSGSAGVTELRFRLLGGLNAVELEGGLSQFASGEWAAQASAQAASFVSLGKKVAIGLTAGATGSDYQGGSWSGMAVAGPLIAVSTGRTLLSAGASGGWVRSVDLVNRATGAAMLRARYRTAEGLALDGGIVGTAAGEAIRYADFTGGITFERTSWLVAGAGGVRVGDLADGPWGQARVEYAPAPVARLEASVGRYPRDLTGFSNGFFVQAGVRLSLGSASPVRAPAVPPVRAERQPSSLTRVTVRYDRPVSVLAIAGGFSEWQPIPLRRGRDGAWSVELRLDTGVHHYALIADGEWTLPAGVAGMDDGLGGRVGVLVVRP